MSQIMQPDELAILIPARAGSKRIPRKALIDLAGHPMISYSIAAARGAGAGRVAVSTNSGEIAKVAGEYGAEVINRPAEIAGDTSRDAEWVRHALLKMPDIRAYMILRPDHPFVSTRTVKQALSQFNLFQPCDSVRSVELVRQHPYKAWMAFGNRIYPLHQAPSGEIPYTDRQYAELPEVYIQNALLEIGWAGKFRTDPLWSTGSGLVYPFHCNGLEAMDINTPRDLDFARYCIDEGLVKLPVPAKVGSEVKLKVGSIHQAAGAKW